MSQNSEKLLRNILITNNKTCNLLEMISIMMSLQMSNSENPYLKGKIEAESVLEKLRLQKRLNKLGMTMGVHNKHKAYKNTVSEQRQSGVSIPLRDV